MDNRKADNRKTDNRRADNKRADNKRVDYKKADNKRIDNPDISTDIADANAKGEADQGTAINIVDVDVNRQTGANDKARTFFFFLYKVFFLFLLLNQRPSPPLPTLQSFLHYFH